MKTSEFVIAPKNRKVTCLLAEPEKLHPDPALFLVFSSSRQDTMQGQPYCEAVNILVDAGHYVLSFDLPNHGDRVKPHGESLEGFISALKAGENPFDDFVEDAISAIDACLERGIGTNGRIYAYGTSRSGYCVLRLISADNRVKGISAIAPVTGWGLVSEFNAIKDSKEITKLSLDNFVPKISGKSIFIVIGNSDLRVNTGNCVDFVSKIIKHETENNVKSGLEFHVIRSEGHSVDEEWRNEGARFLLKLASI